MTYENEDGQEGEGCQFRSNYAELTFGHTRCLVLRPCTGNKDWEPDNCTHCLKLEDDLKNLNSNPRYDQLGKFNLFLKRRESHKKLGIYTHL